MLNSKHAGQQLHSGLWASHWNNTSLKSWTAEKPWTGGFVNSAANVWNRCYYFSQRDFVEALCMKERELDDTRISLREAQRLYEEQKKLANQLQHKINSVGQSFEKFIFSEWSYLASLMLQDNTILHLIYLIKFWHFRNSSIGMNTFVCAPRTWETTWRYSTKLWRRTKSRSWFTMWVKIS